MRLALIGTGLMGYPMAERILENDYPLTVYNRSRHKAEPLAKVGAKIANSPAEAIGNAECVILMLSDAEAIRDVLFNSEPRPDINTRTVIQMSTIAPEESQRLKSDIEKAAGRYLEAPVLGSTPQAKEGKLMVMVGADEKTQFEQWSEVLNCFSSEPLFIGSVGQAAALKLALNQLIASLSAAFSYSLGIIRSRDIDVDVFMNILRGSPLFAPQFEKKLPRLLKREFSDPNFPTKHLRKDVELALKEGETLGLNTASISGILEILQQALEEGWSETDYSSIYNVIQPER